MARVDPDALKALLTRAKVPAKLAKQIISANVDDSGSTTKRIPAQGSDQSFEPMPV